MAADEDKSCDFYAVLGLKKECSAAELRNAYKRLAMKWHPDRFSSAGNSKHVEEAKKKFQAIQEAYSVVVVLDALISSYNWGLTRYCCWVCTFAVLSDTNKRFLYDVGVYDCDDEDDENGMGEFLNEMATMMNQNQSSENREESFEELQELFEEMFQSDIDPFVSSSGSAIPSSCSSSSLASCTETQNTSNKRNSSEISSSSVKAGSMFDGFCIGLEHQEYTRRDRGTGARPGAGAGTRTRGRAGSSKRKNGQKQKVSFGHDYSGVSFS